MPKHSKKIVLFCPHTGAQGGIYPAEAAQITGRTLRTAQRWAQGARIDTASRRLLIIHVFGWLPFPEWQYWKIRGDTLFDARAHHSYWWDLERLDTWWLQIQQLEHYRREYERLSGRTAPRLVPVHTDKKRPA